MDDYPFFGTLVWVKSQEYDKWPAVTTRFSDEKCPLYRDHRYVFLFGVRYCEWIPLEDMEPYIWNGNGNEVFIQDEFWMKACEEANHYAGTSGLDDASSSEDESSEDSEAVLLTNIGVTSNIYPGKSSKQQTKQRTQVAHYCSIPTNLQQNLGEQYKNVAKSPFIFIPKLPDNILRASKITAVDNQSCVMKDLLRHHELNSDCFKCVVPDAKGEKNYRIGVFECSSLGAKISLSFLKQQYQVCIYDDTQFPQKAELIELGAMFVRSPDMLRKFCDIILCFSSSANFAKEKLLSHESENLSPDETTDYIFFTLMDYKTALNVSESVVKSGGRFLEAVLFNRTLKDLPFSQNVVFLISGNDILFKEFRCHLEDISKHIFFVGTAGNATLMNIIFNGIMGSRIGGFSEALSLAKSQLNHDESCIDEFLKIVSMSPLHAEIIANNNAALNIHSTSDLHLRERLDLALQLGSEYHIVTPIASAAFMKCKNAGIPLSEASTKSKDFALPKSEDDDRVIRMRMRHRMSVEPTMNGPLSVEELSPIIDFSHRNSEEMTM